MTNKERWDLILRDEPSPQSFKDFSFYFLISACLQRRVWTGGHDPNIPGSCLFPPIYVVLNGPPGCGKGRVISMVNHCLRYWKLDRASITGEPYSDELDTIAGRTEPRDGLPLFGRTPEDMSYQALLRRQAKATRVTSWIHCRKDEVKPEGTPDRYWSAPMYLVLDEMNLLFHRDSIRICRYLLQAYDCVDVENETITRGTDVVKRPSLGLLAGTTPDDLRKQMTEEVIGNGLTSRIWFIYEMVSGQRLWNTRPMDAEQKTALAELLEYLKSLSLVYGRVNITPEADEYLKEWWEASDNRVVTNPSPLLANYYTRKGIHVRKLMTIGHFMDNNTSYEMGIDRAKWAVEELSGIERKMHYSLNPRGRNPLAMPADKLMTYLYSVGMPVTLANVLSPDGGGMYNELNAMELREVVSYLAGIGKLTMHGDMVMPTKYAEKYKNKISGSGTTPVNGATNLAQNLKALPLELMPPPSEDAKVA